MGKLLGFLLVLLLGIPVALLRGTVLQDFFDWFTPWHIGVVQAVGLTYIVALFTSNLVKPREKKPTDEWWTAGAEALTTSVVVCLFLWLFGWLWHFFL